MPKKEAVYKVENMTENQVGIWMIEQEGKFIITLVLKNFFLF